MNDLLFLEAEGPWPADARLGTSTRQGGTSRGPWSALNLGLGTGDDPAAVAENRRRLRARLALPSEPVWLRQVHGTRVVRASPATRPDREEADAAWTDTPGVVLAVLTADCVPVVFVGRDRLAVAHAGWRGLVRGVLEASLEALGVPPASLAAWIGPAIDAPSYPVGPEVREACLARAPTAEGCFRPVGDGRSFCDLPGVVACRLRELGLGGVHPSGRFTAAEPDRFYSYRRDGVTGRQATLAWFEPRPPDEGRADGGRSGR